MLALGILLLLQSADALAISTVAACPIQRFPVAAITQYRLRRTVVVATRKVEADRLRRGLPSLPNMFGCHDPESEAATIAADRGTNRALARAGITSRDYVRTAYLVLALRDPASSGLPPEIFRTAVMRANAALVAALR